MRIRVPNPRVVLMGGPRPSTDREGNPRLDRKTGVPLYSYTVGVSVDGADADKVYLTAPVLEGRAGPLD